VWYSGIEIYNLLPLALKKLSYDIFRFKAALKTISSYKLFLYIGGIL
jgi:hypothetical protein